MNRGFSRQQAAILPGAHAYSLSHSDAASAKLLAETAANGQTLLALLAKSVCAHDSAVILEQQPADFQQAIAKS
jgi:hypothetical protein